MNLLPLFFLLLGPCEAYAKAVFAHFMVTNSANYSLSDWEDDIRLAQAAHIDAFALNMAYNDPTNAPAVSNAFTAAGNLGFQLFFSFDYAGNGPWHEDNVINYINQYSGDSTYFYYRGKPLASTFEGPAQFYDWTTIKQDTGCFFIPDWSSVGAKVAMEFGTADGLFSWAAWPWGNEDMTTYTDASYIQYLSGSPYMMSASPWFFTNLPGYDKNWLWRGDDLWYDRWQEILYVQPDLVEIISWNDYGESHYIGPLRDNAFAAFSIGEAPFNYAIGMPHDGWRLFLPFVIDTYKNNIASITEEGLVAWYRLSPASASACSSGGTTGNTASQLQIEFEPSDVVQDKVFYSALLASPATVTVSIGGTTHTGTWTHVPDGGIGIYHGSIPFNGLAGEVIVSISRSGTTIAQIVGQSISTSCAGTNGMSNWNAWVGSATSGQSISATPTLPLEKQVCVEGTGANNFAGLCSFGCTYGYCPLGACVCTAMGAEREKPNATDITGYPLAGEDASYSGLCSFDCNYGYCPEGACGTTSAPLSTPTVSDFSPPACIAGTGNGNLAGLCSYSCNFGYCPINSCTCTATGALNVPPPLTNSSGCAAAGQDSAIYDGLCDFACSRGYCPDGACSYTCGDSGSGGGQSGGDSGASTPASVSIKPLPCTTLAESATFTMSAACTDGILALPTSGPDASSNNKPPGTPSECNEVCNFFRLLTGTCCGQGGNLTNPILIPPSVTIPYDIVLSSDFPPPVPITIPVSGSYDPNKVYGTKNPNPTRSCGDFPPGIPLETFAAGVPLLSAITLPAGACNPLPTPLVIQPGPLPNDDPPCFAPNQCRPCLAGACGGEQSESTCDLEGVSCDGNDDDDNDGDDDGNNENDECSVDANPSTDTGYCENGNFPLWNDITGEIDCDMSDSDILNYMTDCQADAEDNFEETVNAIQCQQDECSGEGLSKRQGTCKQPSTYQDGIEGTCDGTFLCDTDIWPNVCNNVRSAIDKKGANAVLQYLGKGLHDTERWYDLHSFLGNGNLRAEGGETSQKRDKGRIPAAMGWGLIGCQVEEYPWGNSISSVAGKANYNDRPTLRLIPQKENGNHGQALGSFFRYLKLKSKKKNPTYCVSVTGNTQPTDYCINAGASCKNKCAAAYGAGFILVNGLNSGDQKAIKKANAPAGQEWDLWFDEVATRKFAHTLSYDPDALKKSPPETLPVTSLMPPQYGTAPSPGQKIYIGEFPNGEWVLSYTTSGSDKDAATSWTNTVTVGEPVTRGAILSDGSNLRWDDATPAAFVNKRQILTRKSDSPMVKPHKRISRIMPRDESQWQALNNSLATPAEQLVDYDPQPQSLRNLSRRLDISGSFLDPAVYLDVLMCPLAADYNDCDDCDGGGYATLDPGAGTVAPYRIVGTATVSAGGSAPTSAPITPGPDYSHWIYFYRNYQSGSQDYIGFDMDNDQYAVPYCSQAQVWEKGGAEDQPPNNIQGITVFGDNACYYQSDSSANAVSEGDYAGVLVCKEWNIANCFLADGGGSCAVNEEYDAVLMCKWD